MGGVRTRNAVEQASRYGGTLFGTFGVAFGIAAYFFPESSKLDALLLSLGVAGAGVAVHWAVRRFLLRPSRKLSEGAMGPPSELLVGGERPIAMAYCPCDDVQAQAIVDADTKEFEGELPGPAALAIHAMEPRSFVGLFDKDGRTLRGYVDFYCLKPEYLKRFLDGRGYAESDFRAAHCLPLESVSETRSLYVGTILANEPRPKNATGAVYAAIAFLQFYLPAGAYPFNLYCTTYSKEGAKVAEGLGFGPAQGGGGDGRKDGHAVLMQTVTEQSLSQVRRRLERVLPAAFARIQLVGMRDGAKLELPSSGRLAPAERAPTAVTPPDPGSG
jgi:hypothetical protein